MYRIVGALILYSGNLSHHQVTVYLDRIDFYVGPGAQDAEGNALDNLATIDVFQGEGADGFQLSTGTLMLLSNGTTGSEWREYILPDPIYVIAGAAYTFRVSVPG